MAYCDYLHTVIITCDNLLSPGLVVKDSCGRTEGGIHSLMEFFPQMTARGDMCHAKNDSLFLGEQE